MNRMECEVKYYIRLLANEVPVQLDLPNAFDTTFDVSEQCFMYRLFEVNAFFDQWIEILRSNELNTCSYNDFVKLCGEPTSN